MFRKAIHAEIEELSEFSWRLQSNIETASYPLDRYKIKQDMIDVMQKYLNGNPKYPDDTVLVLRENEKLAAVVILDVEIENLYLQASGIYAEGDVPRIYNELKSWCDMHFKGCNLHIGLPAENILSCESAIKAGGELIESSDFLRLDPQDFTALQSDMDIRLLSLDNFDEFAAFADKYAADGEVYWNAERIREAFDLWHIYTLHIDNKFAGCVTFLNTAANKEFSESFRCSVTPQYRTSNTLSALLSKGAASEFADGRKYILYSVEDEEAMEREVALQSGFKRIGRYLCYRIACL